MFKFRIRVWCLSKSDTVLLIYSETASSCCISFYICTKHLIVWIDLWKSIELNFTLLIHVAFPLFVRQLPYKITWPNWSHLIELTAILIIYEIDEAIRILPVALPVELRSSQIWCWLLTIFEFMFTGLWIDRNSSFVFKYLVKLCFFNLTLLFEFHPLWWIPLHLLLLETVYIVLYQIGLSGAINCIHWNNSFWRLNIWLYIILGSSIRCKTCRGLISTCVSITCPQLRCLLVWKVLKRLRQIISFKNLSVFNIHERRSSFNCIICLNL